MPHLRLIAFLALLAAPGLSGCAKAADPKAAYEVQSLDHQIDDALRKGRIVESLKFADRQRALLDGLPDDTEIDGVRIKDQARSMAAARSYNATLQWKKLQGELLRGSLQVPEARRWCETMGVKPPDEDAGFLDRAQKGRRTGYRLSVTFGPEALGELREEALRPEVEASLLLGLDRTLPTTGLVLESAPELSGGDAFAGRIAIDVNKAFWKTYRTTAGKEVRLPEWIGGTLTVIPAALKSSWDGNHDFVCKPTDAIEAWGVKLRTGTPESLFLEIAHGFRAASAGLAEHRILP